jgi:hypothetical protein
MWLNPFFGKGLNELRKRVCIGVKLSVKFPLEIAEAVAGFSPHRWSIANYRLESKVAAH